MSDPRNDPIEPPRRESTGCMTALVGIVGTIMLLPGLCAVILAGMDPHEMMVDASWALMILALLAIGVAGIALIWWAVRRNREDGTNRGGDQT